MESFTPFSALAGGALIGLAASLYLLSLGRIAGVSGLLANVLDRNAALADEAPREARSYSAYFLGGLLLAGLIARLVSSGSLATGTTSLALAGAAGLLVGAGARLGSGCTSGHGISGLSRFRGRSIVATLTFMATGILTVAVLRALGALS